MAKSVLNAPHFQDEKAAFAYVEAHLWAGGRSCPHCGVLGESKAMNGKTTRIGLYKCYACRKPFTVRMGSIFESSHLPLHLWLQVIHLMCASKKGISTRQIQRMLSCSMKTAWFLTHRIREAMAVPTGTGPLLGGLGMVVEADEAELGVSKHTRARKGGRAANMKFVTLVERGGAVRSRKITGANGPISMDIHKALYTEIDKTSILHTDGAKHYRYSKFGKQHENVNHDSQFVRDGDFGHRVHCNSAEGYFSIFKRGLVGTYQHMSEQHLERYLAEFDFRMSHREKLGFNDVSRASAALMATKGKRLTYAATTRD